MRAAHDTENLQHVFGRKRSVETCAMVGAGGYGVR